MTKHSVRDPKSGRFIKSNIINKLDSQKKSIYNWGENIGTKYFSTPFEKTWMGSTTNKISAGGQATKSFVKKQIGPARSFFEYQKSRYSTIGKLARTQVKVPKWMKKTGGIGGLVVGATAMLGVGILKGMIGQSKDIVYNRYMQDSQYSRNMLYNSRVGLASGTSSMLNRGGTQGLSLALSQTRHGR